MDKQNLSAFVALPKITGNTKYHPIEKLKKSTYLQKAERTGENQLLSANHKPPLLVALR